MAITAGIEKIINSLEILPQKIILLPPRPPGRGNAGLHHVPGLWRSGEDDRWTNGR